MCKYCDLKYSGTMDGFDISTGEEYIKIITTPEETGDIGESENWYIEKTVEEGGKPEHFQSELVCETSDDGVVGRLPILYCPWCGRKLEEEKK